MLIFSVTTSTRYMSMSFYENNQFISNINIKSNKTHSKYFDEQVRKFFEWNQKKIDEVDTVIISKGPGSFTGIRVSMAYIKAMFLETKAKIYEIMEFDAFEYKISNHNIQSDKELIIVGIIDGQKEKVYVKINKEYMVMQLNDLLEYIKNKYSDRNVIVIGDAMLRHREKIENYLVDNNITCTFTYNFDYYVDSRVYIQMYLDNLLKETTLEELKPDYMEQIVVKSKLS